jgi:hypothetical protein
MLSTYIQTYVPDPVLSTEKEAEEVLRLGLYAICDTGRHRAAQNRFQIRDEDFKSYGLLVSNLLSTVGYRTDQPPTAVNELRNVQRAAGRLVALSPSSQWNAIAEAGVRYSGVERLIAEASGQLGGSAHEAASITHGAQRRLKRRLQEIVAEAYDTNVANIYQRSRRRAKSDLISARVCDVLREFLEGTVQDYEQVVSRTRFGRRLVADVQRRCRLLIVEREVHFSAGLDGPSL